MLPKITHTTVWQQAELLMQPVFIRVVDQIGKQLDKSAWQGTYEDVLIWPDGTSEQTKVLVTQLLQQLEGASAQQAAEIEQAIAQLATPYPGYQLCLQHQDQHFKVDLWQLCYQVCFRNYNSSQTVAADQEVEIDTSLIDETGDVNWQRLDAKAEELVEQVFANLPNV